jgi:hypothetical protein
MSRLVEIYNGLPGSEPVKKFKDRATAVSRIWKAIQNLGGAESAEQLTEAATGEVAGAAEATTVTPQGADVAPAEGTSKEQASPAEPPAETATIGSCVG